MEISPHFALQDFIPKEIFKRYKEKSIRFINPSIINMAEAIYNRFNAKVIINNWHNYIENEYYYNYSGYRPPFCKIGSFMSPHKQGLALDIKIKGLSPEEIKEDIINNYNSFYKDSHITTLKKEKNKKHLHISCQWTFEQNLNII